MSAVKKCVFNSNNIAEGWYWVLSSRELKKNKIKAVNLAGIELIVYRGSDGDVFAMNAYCPHMGAHLAEGKIEGNQVRCFFHNWRFNQNGKCTDIPCLDKMPAKNISIPTYKVVERHNMIWLWLGKGEPLHNVPEVPELAGHRIVSALGNRFSKNCHPNVVMINAIDEQHFRTVHKLPGYILQMEPKVESQHNIVFHNRGCIPKSNWLGRLLSRFYKGPVTYNLSYWYGHLGITTFGPDFLHLHLMFALRPTSEGNTEGQTIAFTKYRKGIIGGLFTKIILYLSKLGGGYFARGDTRVFQTINFNLKTPLAADRAVIHFIKHFEEQEQYEPT